jgi:hypothetical protein
MLDVSSWGPYSIEPTRPYDLPTVALHMRDADQAEVMASSGLSPLEALELSVRNTPEPWTIFAEDVPIAIFGVVPVSVVMRVGLVWLLGTDDIMRYYRPFLRFSRPVIDELMKGYRELFNDVDERNTVSARWLDWCGFERAQTVERGPDRLPFIRFEKRREE